MTRFKKIGFLAAPALALVALSGCASSFKADVARFQQLPAPAGQSFTVVADDPRLAGGLEFSHYADLVSQRLTQTGYVAAGDPARADLIVRVAYGVDNGREKVRSTGFGNPDPFFYGGWGWRGRWGRPWGYGFYDPWLFGPGGYNDVTSYTVYTGDLSMKIDRAADNRRLFEGKAQAQSLSNKLTYLVPNLIDAMFTGFPGQNGENVKITLPPEKKG
ncbi:MULTISPECIES: DUF4136 domain-containing protein [Sphingobium]|jgi:hypothetical protein|uniref:DUF4136 domain-containing protein n=1 Tax=Sphingobium fuliginis (strain ATCC 27551) TaxID=336203 RepID=A0A292ZIJ0_SPHSA|nr:MULTISPECIES: DUF4136 domain-containing protein [Sphingobium]OAP31749.1 lipoprotein transmembrane [Sphingobium sp. 20006FA]AJR24598.1 lipoprotein transmembrane [Sphingobium sp. YBL2]KXU31962.1 lipoprotein transmembrane [Sphingobium sp. AM]KYC31940.1 lipoprotein transmembrane [Sphingobium sp. 22B]MCB4858615.1 DUF4136 domain-containing protein [Sphingobium sp. PNB]